jgi:hypothetical protein
MAEELPQVLTEYSPDRGHGEREHEQTNHPLDCGTGGGAGNARAVAVLFPRLAWHDVRDDATMTAMSRPLMTLLVLLGLASPAAATPLRYYVVVRGVDEAPGVHSGITTEAQKIFLEELRKHAELTLEPPPGLPSDPEQLKDALKAKKLTAYELTLRILSITQQVNPPAPGKQYRTLVRGIKLSIIGDTLPEKVMAVGGNGDAQVGTEIAANANEDKEGKSALLDATKDAVRQAVDMTVTKLKLSDKPPTPKLKKKPKKA